MYFAVEKCGLVNQVERSFTKDEHDVIKLLFRKYDDNGHKIDWPHYSWFKRRKFLYSFWCSVFAGKDYSAI